MDKDSRKILGIIVTFVTAFLLVNSSLILRSVLSDSFATGKYDTVKVYVDGKLVSETHNQVMNIVYDYLVCKVFNDSTACNSAGGYFTTTNYCFSGPGQAAAGKGSFWTFCNIKLGAIGLSTDTSTPSASSALCPSLVTGNGLAAVIASTSHTVNLNTVTLTATWTASGSQSGISKVCLFPVLTYAPSPAAAATYNIATNYAWAQTLLGQTISLTSGQSLTVQWQFSF